jgi:hypothetical protein
VIEACGYALRIALTVGIIQSMSPKCNARKMAILEKISIFLVWMLEDNHPVRAYFLFPFVADCIKK